MALLAFDTGGTFTDFALIDDDGKLHLHKLLSTPASPGDAVVQGVLDLLARPGVACDRAGLRLLGATTVVTNAVLERKGTPTALLTTDGFQDLLRIRTEGRYDLYDLGITYPDPLVPRDCCFGIAGRVAADGRTITPLDQASVLHTAAALREKGLGAVAVCLMHAYRYPAHEAEVARLLAQAAPGVSVSLSSVVCPEIREYERASTTVVNAYAQPLMTRHVQALVDSLRASGVDGGILWMTSSGGVVPSAVAAAMPVRLIESGPAAGALAAAEFARQAGVPSVMSFDMGGTTAKLCLVQDGRPMVGAELEVARHQRFRRGSGFPLRIQSIQMIEISAGGGSIAAKSGLGLLEVGPHSAGAVPGPACYGRGGESPTVTDADVVLGYVGAASLLGGGFSLDAARARSAVQALAESLGIDATRCAFGIHDLVNEAMAEAASMHASDHGIDPAELPVVAFGGAGPVHAYGLARKLRARRIICPAGAGVASALGLLIAPVAADVSASLPMRLDRWEPQQVKALFARLEEEGTRVALQGGVPHDQIVLQRWADLRYVGQGHEISLELPPLALDDSAFLADLTQRFAERYAVLFGRTVQGLPVEAITWRLRAGGPPRTLPPVALPAARDAAPRSRRPVYFEEEGGFVETPVYDCNTLPPHQRIAGPAIIEQAESTIVVGPRAKAAADAGGNVIIDLD